MVKQLAKNIFGEGKLSKLNNEKIDFFTYNIGPTEISYHKTNTEIREDFRETIKNYFKIKLKQLELLARIGINNIIPFNFYKR